MYNLIKCSEEDFETIKKEWFIYVEDIYVFSDSGIQTILVSNNSKVSLKYLDGLNVFNTKKSGQFTTLTPILLCTFTAHRNLYDDAVIAFESEKHFLRWKLTE